MANTILEGITHLPEIEALMSQQLDTENGGALVNLLTECEAWSGYLASNYRQIAHDLAKARAQYWPTTGTVDERLTNVASICADLIQANDYLKDLQEALRQRITLGQSLIRSLRSEMESGLRGKM